MKECLRRIPPKPPTKERRIPPQPERLSLIHKYERLQKILSMMQGKGVEKKRPLMHNDVLSAWRGKRLFHRTCVTSRVGKNEAPAAHRFRVLSQDHIFVYK